MIYSMAENEEFVTHLQEIFDLCDEHHQGYISVEQLKELGKQCFGGSEQDARRLVECLDPNGQGIITFNDFVHGVVAVMQLQNGYDVNDPQLATSEDEDRCSPLPATEFQSPVLFSVTPCDEVDMMSSGGEDALMPSIAPRIPTRTMASSPLISGDTDSAFGPSTDTSRASPEYSSNHRLKPTRSRSPSPLMSDGEEKFECYGEGDELEPCEPGTPLDAKPSLSSDSFRSNSSTGSTGSAGRTRNGGSIQRNSWLRSSLRRASGSSKRPSSNALASQLFRNGAPNGHTSSSRRSSLSCDSDEMYTDQITLEEDVMDLNQKIQVLQQQVSALTESQSTNDDRYSKVKQENAVLMARIHSLEEQIRELEIRSEERLREEERRLKEVMARQEREKNQEIEQYTTRLYNLQQENVEMKGEIMRLKNQIDRLKQEKSELQEQLLEASAELTQVKEEQQKLQELGRREREEFIQERTASAQLLDVVNREVEDLRRYQQEMENKQQRARSPSLMQIPSHYQEQEQELKKLREENRALREANEELQAQLLNSRLEEGRHLIHQGTGSSLADEFDSLSKDQLRKALQEQQECNVKLKSYIDSILLNIMEHYPQLLEVKTNFN